MERPHSSPGEVELYASFRKYLGGRFSAAGLKVHFGVRSRPGVSFLDSVSPTFRDAIAAGLASGLARCFPDAAETVGVTVIAAEEDETASSYNAFYQAALMVVEQARVLVQVTSDQAD